MHNYLLRICLGVVGGRVQTKFLGQDSGIDRASQTEQIALAGKRVMYPIQCFPCSLLDKLAMETCFPFKNSRVGELTCSLLNSSVYHLIHLLSHSLFIQKMHCKPLSFI